jgi:glycosyltransferase involved in cell wall biosynthesis
MDRLARFQNPGRWNIIPHGMDHGRFAPPDRAAARAEWGIAPDRFVVLNVNTNQFRKRQDLTLRAFAELCRHRDDALLVLHCLGAAQAQAGWDLPQLAQELGVIDRVAFVHEQVPVLTDAQLASLYAASDVQVNTAGGEGWGLTSFEGAACGTAQLVPDWSATRELWGGVPGALIPAAGWRAEPKMLNTAHALLDPRALGRQLAALAADPAARADLAARCQAVARRQKPWSAVGDAFADVLDRAVAEPPAALMSLDDVASAREAVVRSEVAGRVDLADPPPPGFLDF